MPPSAATDDTAAASAANDLVMSLIDEDIRGFVQDEADAARASTMTNLITFRYKEKPADDAGKTFSEVMSDAFRPTSQRVRVTADEEPADDEGALDLVKDAFVERLKDQVVNNPSLPPSKVLDAVRQACEKVAIDQVEFVYGSLPTALRRKVELWIDEIVEEVGKRVPFVEGDDAPEGSATKYVTGLDEHLSRCRSVVDKWKTRVEKDTLHGTDLDNLELVPVMKAVFRPYFTLLYLRVFVPQNRVETTHIRRSHMFHPSFLDAQYAGLAMYRVVYDTLMQMRSLYRERAEKREESDAEAVLNTLDLMTAAVSEAMFRDKIDPSARNTDEVFNRVNASSRETKELSQQLYQVSQELETRKHNLAVMAHTREDMRQRAARLRTAFVWTVAVYVLSLGIIVALYVMGRYTILSAFSAVVAVTILVWYLVSLVKRALAKRRRE